jgi:hypothetical protein
MCVRTKKSLLIDVTNYKPYDSGRLRQITGKMFSWKL